MTFGIYNATVNINSDSTRIHAESKYSAIMRITIEHIKTLLVKFGIVLDTRNIDTDAVLIWLHYFILFNEYDIEVNAAAGIIGFFTDECCRIFFVIVRM